VGSTISISTSIFTLTNRIKVHAKHASKQNTYINSQKYQNKKAYKIKY
jgi:hypothetical protein